MARNHIGSILLGFLWLSGCTTVLGMERAELGAEDGGAPPTGTTTPAIRGCEQTPTTGCVECLRGCSDYDGCVADELCRAQLDEYALCLRRTCDQPIDMCSPKLGSPVRQTCLSNCKNECEQTMLATPCELYCACMGSNCSDETSIEPCIETCNGWDSDVVACRRDHCLFAKDDERTLHCGHASGVDDVCDTGLPPADDRHSCPAKRETGWACNHGSECCTNTCLDGRCK